jgi:mannose-1-phosphate guanylyltransferase
MKAFLLAAGKGSRLQPITEHMPKCLVPINGKPILQIWLELCARYEIEEVLINLYHFPDLVRNFIHSSTWNLKINLVHEEKLLGSGGTVLANKEFVKNEERFFIFYADNLTNVNLMQMTNFDNMHRSPLTMGLFRTDSPETCGIAEVNENSLIIGFEEKPKKPKSNLANAGIYLAKKEIWDYFPHQEFIDFGFDILPRLVGKMYGYEMRDYLMDIGTIENYNKAQETWKEIVLERG